MFILKRKKKEAELQLYGLRQFNKLCFKIFKSFLPLSKPYNHQFEYYLKIYWCYIQPKFMIGIHPFMLL